MQHTPRSTSEIAEQHSDRGAVLARLSWEWTVLHEMSWPGRSEGTLDHVAIGPSGIFAIVVGDDAARAAAGADAVAGMLRGLPRERVRGVLVGPDHPAPWVEVQGAILCESVDLTRMLRSFPPVLTREELAGIVGVVHVGLERAEQARAADASRSASVMAHAAAAAPRAGALGQDVVGDLPTLTTLKRRFRRGRSPWHQQPGPGITARTARQ